MEIPRGLEQGQLANAPEIRESLPTPDETLRDLANRLDLPIEQMADAVDPEAFAVSSPDQQLRFAYNLLPDDMRATIENQSPDALKRGLDQLRTNSKRLMPVLQAAALAYTLGGCAPKQAEKPTAPEQVPAPITQELRNEAPVIPEGHRLTVEERADLIEAYDVYNLDRFNTDQKFIDSLNDKLVATHEALTDALEDKYTQRMDDLDSQNYTNEQKSQIKDELFRQKELDTQALYRDKEKKQDEIRKQQEQATRRRMDDQAKWYKGLYKASGLTFSFTQENALLNDYLTKIKSPRKKHYIVEDNLSNIHVMARTGVADAIASWIDTHPGSTVDVLAENAHFYEPGNKNDKMDSIVLQIQEPGKSPVIVRGEVEDRNSAEPVASGRLAAERALTAYLEKQSR